MVKSTLHQNSSAIISLSNRNNHFKIQMGAQKTSPTKIVLQSQSNNTAS